MNLRTSASFAPQIERSRDRETELHELRPCLATVPTAFTGEATLWSASKCPAQGDTRGKPCTNLNYFNCLWISLDPVDSFRI